MESAAKEMVEVVGKHQCFMWCSKKKKKKNQGYTAQTGYPVISKYFCLSPFSTLPPFPKPAGRQAGVAWHIFLKVCGFQTPCRWAPKKPRSSSRNSCIMKQQVSHKAHTSWQQNSKLSNSCSLWKQCTMKNPEFFQRGEKTSEHANEDKVRTTTLSIPPYFPS